MSLAASATFMRRKSYTVTLKGFVFSLFALKSLVDGAHNRIMY